MKSVGNQLFLPAFDRGHAPVDLRSPSGLPFGIGIRELREQSFAHTTDTETSPDACPLAFARMTISTSRSSSVRKRSRRSDENRLNL